MHRKLCERANLKYLDLICEALGCELDEILVHVSNATVNSKAFTPGKKVRK